MTGNQRVIITKCNVYNLRWGKTAIKKYYRNSGKSKVINILNLIILPWLGKKIFLFLVDRQEVMTPTTWF